MEVEENPEGQPPEVVEQSQAFAKRLQERTQAALMEERQRWEQEVSERYGNYDTYDRAMNFFMKQAGYNDLNSMMQAIEQQDLLQRAEKFGVTPEIQQNSKRWNRKRACRGTRVSARTTRIITTFYASIRAIRTRKGS